jgi:hypothetical protein
VQYLVAEGKADIKQRNALDESTLLMHASKSGNGKTVSYVFGLFETKKDATENVLLENKVLELL